MDAVDAAAVERSIRRELAALDAQLATIPGDRFAERAPVLRRRAEVAAELRAVVVADPDTLARWADRAGSKETGDGSVAFIGSRFESGSM